MKKEEERDGWLAGPEPDESDQKSLVDEFQTPGKDLGDVGEITSGGLGLDGEPLESPDSYFYSHKKAEPAKKADTVPLSIIKATETLSHILMDLIQRTMMGGWDNRLKVPSQRFIEVEGKDFRKMIGKFNLTSIEKCAVCRLLKNGVTMKNEKEQIIKDALLQFAFPHCS